MTDTLTPADRMILAEIASHTWFETLVHATDCRRRAAVMDGADRDMVARFAQSWSSIVDRIIADIPGCEFWHVNEALHA